MKCQPTQTDSNEESYRTIRCVITDPELFKQALDSCIDEAAGEIPDPGDRCVVSFYSRSGKQLGRDGCFLRLTFRSDDPLIARLINDAQEAPEMIA